MPRVAIVQPDRSYTLQTILPGAISTGNIWQFGQFDRQSREVAQDLDLYRVPADLEALLRILVKILEPQTLSG